MRRASIRSALNFEDDAFVFVSAIPAFSTHRRKTESRSPSSFATEPTERPLDATSPTACCL
jgi:hypothetical protein